MDRPRQSGQAAVETVGTMIVVALLLASVGVWLARAVTPPAEPPDAIGRVAASLELSPSPLTTFAAHPRPYQLLRGDGDGSIARAVRAFARRTVASAGLARECERVFDAAFRARVAERRREILADPFVLIRPPDLSVLLHPDQAATEMLNRARALWEYQHEVRRLGGREAALRISGDAGRVAADTAIDVVQSRLLGAASRLLRRPLPSAPTDLPRRGGDADLSPRP